MLCLCGRRDRICCRRKCLHRHNWHRGDTGRSRGRRNWRKGSSRSLTRRGGRNCKRGRRRIQVCRNYWDDCHRGALAECATPWRTRNISVKKLKLLGGFLYKIPGRLHNPTFLFYKLCYFIYYIFIHSHYFVYIGHYFLHLELG